MNKNLYKYIWENTKYLKLYFTTIIIINFSNAIAMILFALFSKKIIDLAILSDKNNLIIYSIGLIILLFLTIIMRVSTHFLEQKFKILLEKTFETEIFKNILYLPQLEEHSGSYVSKLTLDIDNITEGITRFIPNIVNIATKIILSFLLLIWISYILAIIILIFGLITLLFFKVIKPKMIILNKRVLETTSKKREFFQESIENKMIINSFQKENNFINKGKELSENSFQKKYNKIKFSLLLNTSVIFSFQMFQFFVLIFCAFQIANKEITAGDLTAILQLVSYIQSPLMNINQLSNKYFNMITSYKRINELLIEKKSLIEIYQKFDKITIKDLTYSYNDKPLLKDINLEVQKNEFITIIGESGCGKSTLFKLMLGIIKNEKQTILLDNIKVTNIESLIAYVPQANSLFSGTIKDNLTFYDPIDNDKIKKALKTCQLDDFIDNIDEDINYLLKEKNQGVSEGQAQRLNIARAILQNRPILLLDESTSSLDKKTEENILNNLKKLNKTIIFISHKNKVFKYSDHVYELKNNRLVLRGDL